MRLTINQREADRHERCRDKIREKRVRGHLLKVSAELHCHHRSGRSARTDDADEQSLEQDKVIAPHIECENKPHRDCTEAMIIYRFYFEGVGMTDKWWNAFRNLSEEEMSIIKPIIESNNFNDLETKTNNLRVLDVLEFYRIKREDAEKVMKSK